MSGGHFDYLDMRMVDIYSAIELEIYGEELDDDWEVEDYIRDHYLSEEEIEYLRENRHTLPNPNGYSKETIAEFKKAVRYLKLAEVYTHRIDWLLSGDDGEESFHKRLKEDLKELRR